MNISFLKNSQNIKYVNHYHQVDLVEYILSEICKMENSMLLNLWKKHPKLISIDNKPLEINFLFINH